MFFAYHSKLEVIHEIIEYKYTQTLSEYSLFKPHKFHFRTIHIVISRQEIYHFTINIACQRLPITAINVIIMILSQEMKVAASIYFGHPLTAGEGIMLSGYKKQTSFQASDVYRTRELPRREEYLFSI